MQTVTICPSCGHKSTPFSTCPGCGLIVEKYLVKQAEKAQKQWDQEVEKAQAEDKKATEIERKRAINEAIKNRKKSCKYCKSEIPQAATICPHCRKQVATSPAKLIFVGVFAACVFAVVGLVTANKPTSSSEPKVQITPAQIEAQNRAENQAIELVKNCPVQVNGATTSLLGHMTLLLDVAKSAGAFIQFDGWEAVKSSGSVYNVYVHYKSNGVSKEGKWEANLDNKTVKALNQEAFTINGRVELLVAN